MAIKSMQVCGLYLTAMKAMIIAPSGFKEKFKNLMTMLRLVERSDLATIYIWNY